MRYQEKMYNKSGVHVKNITNNNVNMSSDICVFNTPTFNMDGAGKIGNLSASTGTYIIDGESSGINLTFNYGSNALTGGTEFKYSIYKYRGDLGVFQKPSKYDSQKYNNVTAITETIPIEMLEPDGEYLVKGYYEHKICTNILRELGLKNDTSDYKVKSNYGMYDDAYDYYFTVIGEAQKPMINGGDNRFRNPIGSLIARSVLPEPGSVKFVVDGNIRGDLLVYLNGILLSSDNDYTISNNIIELNGETLEGDILTYVSVKDSDKKGLIVDNILISESIVSGATDNQGSNNYYYNQTEGKYEVYTELTPTSGNDIVITLNGATLANNIDYYQSISNPKRIILNGDLDLGDVINIIYNTKPQYVNGIYTNNPIINWNISKAPSLNNGVFTVEVATNKTFNNIIFSGTTDYKPNINSYSKEINISGTVGTNLVYRVINDKNYETIDDGIINSRAISEVIPITIMSNSINSY